MRGLSTDVIAVNIFGNGTIADATNATNSSAVVELRAAIRSGTGVTGYGATDNIVGGRNGGTSVLLLKGNGDLNLGGTVGSISDARVKSNVKRLNPSNSYEKVREFLPSHYDKDIGIGDVSHEYGLVADELLEVAPEFVIRGSDKPGNYHSNKYQEINVLLISAFQEAQRRIEKLEAMAQ